MESPLHFQLPCPFARWTWTRTRSNQPPTLLCKDCKDTYLAVGERGPEILRDNGLLAETYEPHEQDHRAADEEEVGCIGVHGGEGTLDTELQKDSETCSSEGAPCLTVVNQTRSPRQGVFPQTSCRVQLPQLGDGLA